MSDICLQCIKKTTIISDFMEMMMMQNAQMHHMVMQQLMANSLQQGNSKANLPVLSDAQLVTVQVVMVL